MWSLSYVWKCTFFPVSIFIEKVIYFTNWYQGDLFYCLTSFTILLLLCSFLSLGNQNHKSFGFVFHVLGPAIGIAFHPLRVPVLIPPASLPLQTGRLEAIFFDSYTFSYSYAALMRRFGLSTAFCSQLCLLTIYSDVSLCRCYDLSPLHTAELHCSVGAAPWLALLMSALGTSPVLYNFQYQLSCERHQVNKRTRQGKCKLIIFLMKHSLS